MSTYIYSEEGHSETFEAADDEAAEQIGMQWLREGDHDEAGSTKTFRVRATVTRGDDEDDSDSWPISLVHTFEPTEPPCVSDGESFDGHAWRGSRATGSSGGGVVMEDVCDRCGLVETVNTWDIDPTSGGVMVTTAYGSVDRWVGQSTVRIVTDSATQRLWLASE